MVTIPEPSETLPGGDVVPDDLAHNRDEEGRCVAIAGAGLTDLCGLADQVFSGAAEIGLDDVDHAIDDFAEFVDRRLEESSRDIRGIRP